jgi:hypothetical protein
MTNVRARTPAEVLARGRAASPGRRSSNANSLCGQNSAGSGQSERPFNGIFCDDVSEFESDHLSQPVRSLWAMSGGSPAYRRRAPITPGWRRNSLSTDRADESLNASILPGRSGCDRTVPNAHGTDPLQEDWTIRGVSIPNEISRRVVPRERGVAIIIRARNLWNSRWWSHVHFCSAQCEDRYELERSEANAKPRWRSFFALG